MLARLPTPVLCALLALAWVAAPVAGALHTVAVAHAVCAEHRVVEHAGHDGHADEHHGDADDGDHDDGDHDGDHDPGHDEDHGACSLIAATAGGSTPVGTLSATAPATAGPSAPLVAAFGPRGPPILAYAAKTSPPTA